MNLPKDGLLLLSSMARLNHLFGESPRTALTTLLYHRFFAPGEAKVSARDRLHRQLEWLQSHYTILSLSEAVHYLESQTPFSFPLTVTVDDAYIDLLDVYDVFEDHGVPVHLFVCTGWVDNNEPPTAQGTISRVIDFVRWHKGGCLRLDLGPLGSADLTVDSAPELADRLIQAAAELGQEFVERTWASLLAHRGEMGERKTCTWEEIWNLRQRGVGIGSHSVTHCKMAECSDTRLRFELEESRRTLEKHVGTPDFFAYPFGTIDVVNARTTSAVANAGYKAALLTYAGFAQRGADRFTLPRLTIPDTVVHPALYRALVRGGKVALERLTPGGSYRKMGST
jgi:peptidoglycan/xylan/chitin deacetylase (PgdA/CDA1 family)